MKGKKKERKETKSDYLEEIFQAGHTACAGCGAAIAMRHIANTAGKNSILSIATGCMEVVSTAYPMSAWKIPAIHTAFESSASTASGIEAALKKLGKDSKVIAIAGDGGTFDIGLQALSGAIERGHNMTYICYDNEAYENTGVQRSSSTPKYAVTTTTPEGKLEHGKKEWKKNMPFIVASHGNVYVATANVAYMEDFEAKLKKALARKGPSYIQVLTPCVPGWGIQENITIQAAKLAVLTRMQTLYEIEEGVVKLNVEIGHPKNINEYFKLQGRFKDLNEKEKDELQKKSNEDYEKIKKLSDLKLKIF